MKNNIFFFLLDVIFGWLKKNHCPLLTTDTVRGDGGTLFKVQSTDEWTPQRSHL